MRIVYAILASLSAGISTFLFCGGGYGSDLPSKLTCYADVAALVQVEERHAGLWLISALATALFAALGYHARLQDRANALRDRGKAVPLDLEPRPLPFYLYFAALVVVGLTTLFCLFLAIASDPVGTAGERITVLMRSPLAGWYTLAGIPTAVLLFVRMVQHSAPPED